MTENLTTGAHPLSRRQALAQRFELVRVLGEGASCSVYLVRDLANASREVALKVLEDPQAFDEHTLRRFKEELRVLRTLQHPNLIEAYDLIDLGDTVAYTMEVVDGRDLSRFVRDRSLDAPALDKIFDQLLSALHELHRHNILHRDIKLENVLLANDGTVKLSDLGLMKKLDSQALTRAGVLLGTAQYMPPEYIKRGRYDARGDLYAVGIMLYELLTGKRRFAEMPGAKVIEHLVKTKFAVPELAVAHAPRRYQEILRRVLDPDPQNRYQSADEMREAFQMPDTPVRPAKEGVVLNSNLQLGDFDRPRPLVTHFKSSAMAIPQPRRSLRARFVFVTGLSFLGLVGAFHLRTAWSGFTITQGRYEGRIAPASGTARWARSTITDRGLTIEEGLPGCAGRTAAIEDSTLDCRLGSYRFKIDGASGDGFFGTLVNVQTGAVSRFEMRLAARGTVK